MNVDFLFVNINLNFFVIFVYVKYRVFIDGLYLFFVILKCVVFVYKIIRFIFFIKKFCMNYFCGYFDIIFLFVLVFG